MSCPVNCLLNNLYVHISLRIACHVLGSLLISTNLWPFLQGMGDFLNEMVDIMKESKPNVSLLTILNLSNCHDCIDHYIFSVFLWFSYALQLVGSLWLHNEPTLISQYTLQKDNVIVMFMLVNFVYLLSCFVIVHVYHIWTHFSILVSSASRFSSILSNSQGEFLLLN